MDNKRKIIPTIKITLIFGIFLLFIKPAFTESTNSWLKATIENKIIEKINIDSTKKSDDKGKAYLLKGNEFFAKGSYPKAITYLEKAIQLNPNIAKVYNNLAMTYIHLENDQQAITNLEKAIQLDPNFVKAYNNLGIVYEKIGDYEKAISYFKKVIDVDPQYIEAYTRIASIYIKLEDYQKVLTYSKKAYQMKPDNVNNNIAVYLALGTAYGGLRDYINAKKYYQKARELCEQQGNQKCAASTKKWKL